MDKPAGIPTVSPRAKATPSAWSILRRMLKERDGEAPRAPSRRGGPPVVDEDLFLIHRLDQPASGLLIFARTERVRDGLKEMLAARTIERRYAAVVVGRPIDPEGEIHSRLVEIPGVKPKVRSLRTGDGVPYRTKARDAVTRYRFLGTERGLSALELTLETGRKHQIRVHLAESGFPVVGDRLYGGSRSASVKADRLLLHAWVLRFQHPVTRRRLELISPPGEAFEKAVRGAFRLS